MPLKFEYTTKYHVAIPIKRWLADYNDIRDFIYENYDGLWNFNYNNEECIFYFEDEHFLLVFKLKFL